MAGNYDQTMGLEPPQSVLIWGALTASIALAAVIKRSFNAFDGAGFYRRCRQGLLALWLTSLIFLTWKHGFVRADKVHVVFFAGFVQMVGPLILTLPCHSRSAKRWGACLGVACCALSTITLQCMLYPQHLRVDRPIQNALENLSDLSQPRGYWQEADQELESERSRIALPDLQKIIGSGTVDVLGNHQSYAVLNSLNYRPRPVFQSYAAYSASLMTLNEQFYLSVPPDYVICRLTPIDFRFPPLEDALSLRNLLINYDLAASDDHFLLFKARQPAAPVLTLLAEGTVQLGEKIDLTRFKDLNTWLQITLDPTLAGRLRQFVYQPPHVRLTIWDRAAGQHAAFRAPVPMLAAGFLATPLLLRNASLVAIYSRNSVTRPTAYSLEMDPGSASFWQSSIHFRLYKIENAFGTRLPEFMQVSHDSKAVPGDRARFSE